MRQPVLSGTGVWGAEHIIMLDSTAHNFCFDTSQHHALSGKIGSSLLQHAKPQMFLTAAAFCSF